MMALFVDCVTVKPAVIDQPTYTKASVSAPVRVLARSTTSTVLAVGMTPPIPPRQVIQRKLSASPAKSISPKVLLRGTLSLTFEEGTSAAWLYDLLKPHVSDLVVNPLNRR